VQLCLGAFKAGMREFTANVSGNDLVRVTGYMVRLSDLEKFRAEGSRTNTTWLGEEAARNTRILERQPRVVSHEQQMRAFQIESRHHENQYRMRHFLDEVFSQ
jgi:hypothetical protein